MSDIIPINSEPYTVHNKEDYVVIGVRHGTRYHPKSIEGMKKRIRDTSRIITDYPIDHIQYADPYTPESLLSGILRKNEDRIIFLPKYFGLGLPIKDLEKYNVPRKFTELYYVFAILEHSTDLVRDLSVLSSFIDVERGYKNLQYAISYFTEKDSLEYFIIL